MLFGKTALIAGATGGIGSAVAEKLASIGCNLVLMCRTATRYASLANRLEKYGVKTEKLICDFQNENSILEAVEKINNMHIDILVNAAGQFPIKTIIDSTLEDYKVCFDTNVKAPYLLSSSVGRQMCGRKWGRIVNIGSSSSYNGSAETGIYCASKHALLGLTKSLHQEFRPHNVRVYSVSPGSTQTSMGKTDTRQDFTTFITPEEVAEYVSFIMSFDGEGISEEIRINRMVVR